LLELLLEKSIVDSYVSNPLQWIDAGLALVFAVRAVMLALQGNRLLALVLGGGAVLWLASSVVPGSDLVKVAALRLPMAALVWDWLRREQASAWWVYGFPALMAGPYVIRLVWSFVR